MALLYTKNLSAGYGKLVIVNEASIRVDPGQIFLLIGANGSGKSTLIKSIIGLTALFQGSIIFRDKDITRTSTFEKIKLGIGYCPQIGNIFYSLTVRTNFELGTYAAEGEVSVRERIDEILQLFPDLKGRLDSKASTLSGGLRQMVALGRALMGRPSVLMLDEPTAGMAPMAVKGFLAKVAELRERGIAIILVEQNVRSAVEFADYVYLMSQGRVISEYTGADIRKLDVGELMLKSVAAKA